LFIKNHWNEKSDVDIFIKRYFYTALLAQPAQTPVAVNGALQVENNIIVNKTALPLTAWH